MVVLKYLGGVPIREITHNVARYPRRIRMGDKNKKKLTKKELKAQNHAKLMSSKKGGIVPTQQTGNVIELNAYRDQKDKKAA
jgi:hypothetical protein